MRETLFASPPDTHALPSHKEQHNDSETEA